MVNDVMKCILDSLVEPIVFIDTDHIIRYMNPAACVQLQKYGGSSWLENPCLTVTSRSRVVQLVSLNSDAGCP